MKSTRVLLLLVALGSCACGASVNWKSLEDPMAREMIGKPVKVNHEEMCRLKFKDDVDLIRGGCMESVWLDPQLQCYTAKADCVKILVTEIKLESRKINKCFYGQCKHFFMAKPKTVRQVACQCSHLPGSLDAHPSPPPRSRLIR